MYIRRWSCVHPQERWTGYEYSFLMLATGDPLEMATYIAQSALQASKDAHANISLVLNLKHRQKTQVWSESMFVQFALKDSNKKVIWMSI